MDALRCSTPTTPTTPNKSKRKASAPALTTNDRMASDLSVEDLDMGTGSNLWTPTLRDSKVSHQELHLIYVTYLNYSNKGFIQSLVHPF